MAPQAWQAPLGTARSPRSQAATASQRGRLWQRMRMAALAAGEVRGVAVCHCLLGVSILEGLELPLPLINYTNPAHPFSTTCRQH